MRRDPTQFRERFKQWKNGAKVYEAGLPKYEDGKDAKLSPIVPFKLKAEVIITPDKEYNIYLNTLPDNQRFTPNDKYDSYLYWKLNGKPKNFEEAYNKEMFTFDRSDKSYHANSIAYDDNTGIGYFMKPKDHSTIKYELDWFNKGLVTEEGGYQRPETFFEWRESQPFRNNHILVDDPNRPNFYMYKPILSKQSLGLKLPKYEGGKSSWITNAANKIRLATGMYKQGDDGLVYMDPTLYQPSIAAETRPLWQIDQEHNRFLDVYKDVKKAELLQKGAERAKILQPSSWAGAAINAVTGSDTFGYSQGLGNDVVNFIFDTVAPVISGKAKSLVNKSIRNYRLPKTTTKELENAPINLEETFTKSKPNTNFPDNYAGLYDFAEDDFVSLVDGLQKKIKRPETKYKFVDERGNVNMRDVTKAVRQFYKDNPNARSYKEIVNSSGNLYQHTKDVVKSALLIPVPDGYTRQLLVEAALYHDIGKVLDNTIDHGRTSFDILNKMHANGDIFLDNNVGIAVNKHMSSHIQTKDNLTKALHFADVARGVPWDDASFKFRHLSYDWNKPKLNIPKLSLREELKTRINPWLKNKGYQTIDLNSTKELALQELTDRIIQHRSFLRGARDPIKLQSNSTDPNYIRNKNNSVESIMADYGLSKEVAESPSASRLRVQNAITNVSKDPTGSSRRSHLFGDKLENGLIKYTDTNYSKMLGVDKNKQDALYISTSDDVASNYADTRSNTRYGEADVVALPINEKLPGESLSEFLLRNDFEMIDLNFLRGLERGAGSIYEDPYRLQTGRSLREDMISEGIIKPKYKRNYNNILSPDDPPYPHSGITYDITKEAIDKLNEDLNYFGISKKFETLDNGDIVNPHGLYRLSEDIGLIKGIYDNLRVKMPASVSRTKKLDPLELFESSYQRLVDDSNYAMYKNATENDPNYHQLPPDDLFAYEFEGPHQVTPVANSAKLPDLYDFRRRIGDDINVSPYTILSDRQIDVIRKAFRSTKSDPTKYMNAEKIIQKVLSNYFSSIKGKKFPKYKLDYNSLKATPEQMASFMREKGVLPRYEIEGYGKDNVYVIEANPKNKTKNAGDIDRTYGYIIGEKGLKKLNIVKKIDIKDNTFTGFGSQKDQGKYAKGLKISRKTLRSILPAAILKQLVNNTKDEQ